MRKPKRMEGHTATVLSAVHGTRALGARDIIASRDDRATIYRFTYDPLQIQFIQPEYASASIVASYPGLG